MGGADPGSPVAAEPVHPERVDRDEEERGPATITAGEEGEDRRGGEK
jgi:hypothetical protein